MDTVDVIDGDVQTAQPVNLVNNLNCQQPQLSTTSAVNDVRRQPSQHRPKTNAPAATRDCPSSKQRTLRLGCITRLGPRCRATCWRVNRRRSTKSETESLREPEKIEQKFANSRLPQGMRRVLDRRIGQCWESTPGGIVTAPSRCRRQVQWAWRSRASRPALATCLWPQRGKSRGFGGRAPKNAQHLLFIHLIN